MKKLLKEINRVIKNNKLSDVQNGILILLQEEIITEIKMSEKKEENLKKAIILSQNIKNVQLGCGNHLLDNYINIDINEVADIFWDVRKGLPFESETIDRIFSEHFLEHIDYPVSVNKLLKESYRVLNKNGEFIIGVPDCDYPLNDIYNNDNKNMKISKDKWYFKRKDVIENMETGIDYLNFVMRDQLFHKKFHHHYWGYNIINLTLLLKKHGFKNIRVWDIDKNIINPKREWGTLYLIANK